MIEFELPTPHTPPKSHRFSAWIFSVRSIQDSEPDTELHLLHQGEEFCLAELAVRVRVRGLQDVLHQLPFRLLPCHDAQQVPELAYVNLPVLVLIEHGEDDVCQPRFAVSRSVKRVEHAQVLRLRHVQLRRRPFAPIRLRGQESTANEAHHHRAYNLILHPWQAALRGLQLLQREAAVTVLIERVELRRRTGDDGVDT